MTLAALHRYPEAEASYRQALQLEPDYIDAYNNLGECLRHQGRTAEAIAAYQQALRLAPERFEFYSNLGNGWQQLGNLAEAEAAYQQALRLHPDYAQAHNNYGVTLEKLDRVDEAIVEYREALRLYPDYAEAHLNLGNALLAQEDSAAAEECYRHALRLESRDAGGALQPGGGAGHARASGTRRWPVIIAPYNSNLNIQKLTAIWAALCKNSNECLRQRPVFNRRCGSSPTIPTRSITTAPCCKNWGVWRRRWSVISGLIELRPDHAETWCNLGTARLYPGTPD